jgi:hypothetical protein
MSPRDALLRGCIVLGSVLAGGCTTTSLDQPLPPAPSPAPIVIPLPPPPPAPPPLTDYLQKVRSMPGNELLAETQHLLERGDDRARLQAAIALAQPQHPARDEARAVALADEIARSTDAPSLRDLAAVVALWLDEQRRAEANGRRAQTKGREDEARLQMVETRLREMERRAQDAEKKLEALRAIERDLSGRTNSNGRP